MRRLNVVCWSVVGLGLIHVAAASKALGACDPSKPVVEIAIQDMKFIPSVVEACVGQLIRWTNLEPSTAPRVIRHTVTADPALSLVPGNVVLPEGAETFASDFLVPGDIFEQTLTVVGEYKYICRPHERMGHVGSILVVNPPETPTE